MLRDRRSYGVSLMLMSACALSACDDNHGRSSNNPQTTGNRQSYLGPAFPGAGASSVGQSIAAGVDSVTCDGVGPGPANSAPVPGETSTMTCLWGADATVPEAAIEWVVESAGNAELVHVRLTLNPAFCDNTYGTTAIGWGDTAAAPAPGGAAPAPGGKPAPGGMKKPGMGKSGHTFKDLVGSDHAEFKLSDKNGALTLHFKLDYITEAASAASGYATLGVTGGEGKMLAGDASSIVAASTSLDRNLNGCGMPSFLTDSPATDENYTPNAAAKNWDYRVVYDVWVRQDAFGSSGFGSAVVDFVHASPSKRGENSVDVTPGDCPPNWPPYCSDPDGCGGGGGADDPCLGVEPGECGKGGDVDAGAEDAGTPVDGDAGCAWVVPPPLDPDTFRPDPEPVWTCPGDASAE